MTTKWRLITLGGLMAAGAALLLNPATAQAWGGLLTQQTPITQTAERVIFTRNADGTLSAIIDIQYEGGAEGFAWLLPVPASVTEADIELLEDAGPAFGELQSLTNPLIVPPVLPECAIQVMEERAAGMQQPGFQGTQTGTVGPASFEIIDGQAPEALDAWLAQNEYQLDAAAQAAVANYRAEGASFLVMRFEPESPAQRIQPVRLTYQAAAPSIPLRLSAATVQAPMPLTVWFFADAPAIPENYASFELADADFTFATMAGSNYADLLTEQIEAADGQAFITEYASPSGDLTFTHPLLLELQQRHTYLTRLYTTISPAAMTLDPAFEFDFLAENVSNVRDLSRYTGLYDCERQAGEEIGEVIIGVTPSPGVDQREPTGTPSPTRTPRPASPVVLRAVNTVRTALWVGIALVFGAMLVMAALRLISRRRDPDK